MPKTTAERMAELRARQADAGLVPLSLVVPVQDVALFRAFADERRRLQRAHRGRVARQHWLSMLQRPVPVPVPKRATARAAAAAQRPPGASRAEALAQALLQRVIELGWPVGQPLGAEAELMHEHRVSRTVLRQAVRLLAHHAVVRTVRGAGGGLVVAEPDLRATMRAVSLYLEYCRIGPEDILETRRWLETATITGAVARLTPAGEQRLREAIEREAMLDADASTEAAQHLHLLIAELCGDPALGLFARIVLHLSESHSAFADRPPGDRARVVQRLRRLHAAIVEAMLARDLAKALDGLRRYLDGYRSWMKPRHAT